LNANEILNNYKQGIANIRARTRTAASQLALSTAEWSNERELDANTDIKGLWHFTDGTGSTASDASGNGNNGTLTNGPIWTSSGKFGNALAFDGVDDYVQKTSPSSIPTGNTARTVEAWIYINGETGKYQPIVSYGSPGNNNQAFSLEFGGDSSQPSYKKLIIIGWNNDFWGVQTLNFNQWYHVAVTHDGTIVKLYVDGVLDNSTTKTYNTVMNANGLRIGASANPDADAWHKYFNGKIDEVAIWNRALSADEVLELYKRSQYYAAGSSAIASDSNQFIEVQALLETENASYTPVLRDLNISCT